MNQLVSTDQTSTKEIAMASGAGGSSIAPQNLGEVVRFAEVMCRADIALPQHLRGNAGACMAVAMQALEWQMSPFAVASKSYAVGGRIAYEAQLIAAVVNTRSGIKGRLRYEYRGEGADLSCRVTGILDGQECEYETPPFSAILVKNSPLWKSDPRQQLGYFAARSWARRHCPEVILGVYDRDEMEHQGPTNAKDVTPSVMARLTAQETQQPASPEREGFDAAHVLRETSALSGGAEIEQQSTIQEPSADGSSVTDDGSGVDAPHRGPAAEQSEPASGGPAEAGDMGAREEPDALPASNSLSAEDKAFLVRVFKTMKVAVGPELNVFKRQALVFTDEIGGKSNLVRAKATKIRTELERCCGDEPAAGTVEVGKYLAGIIGVEERELVE
ncbi:MULTISPECIES: recombinase RecT [unclassified Mesorhizobium]|uniref:recombinase RecT n=1 Tax=unclassified Mesorhizobium TaxID=325217 RepID=UPI001126DD84|nr:MULTISPECIES: recombinase RecT [unclassified Mesorhizobium]TPJ70492.1 recombinase RecT [Mesorhizobium sp. B2-6-7]TPJ76851.1 recombinase RecT [Mesorhizobium sp. B2-6-3]